MKQEKYRKRPRATIVDIAKEIGFSPATVSNALNDRRYVDADTKRKVEEAAVRLGYKPNVRAQRLRTGGADTIALLSSMPFSIAAGPSRLGFLMEIAAVAATTALENGMALVLVPPQEKSGPPIDQLAIDGAIVIEPEANDEAIRRLQRAGLPVVSIGRQPDQEKPVPFVDLHSERSAEILLTHLYEQGARAIALVIGSARRNSYLEAETSFIKFANRHNLQHTILRIDETDGEEGAFVRVRQLLETFPGIDGLCVPVDAFAVGALRAATLSGRTIPNDIRIVTRYDGIRARQTLPNLTALDLHLELVAAKSIELLMECIRGNAAPVSLEGPLPTLIARGSSMG